MSKNPRLYAGYQDLIAIQNLQRVGLRAFPHSYVHPGDIEWWFFYNPRGEPPEKSVFLWEDDHANLLGWMIVYPRFMLTDMAVQPHLRGSDLEDAMIDHAEAHLRPHVTTETPEYEFGSVFGDYPSLSQRLTQRGYASTPNIMMFQQALSSPLMTPSLPTGYRFLDKMDVHYKAERATVHYSAFTPTSVMTPDYYQQFMQTAPSYRPENDVVIMASDGRFVAFAMTWADTELERGEFEPVGTHQDFHRQGFGKAVMLEGLRRLQAQGMTVASVTCDAQKAGNIAFYQSCGFTPVNTIYRFNKPVLATL
jgi:ribosomal protein S18 acetylase RimI-like enzyme